MEITGPFEGKYRVGDRIQQRASTKWHFLYEIDRQSIDSNSIVLMQRYSRYKYGDTREIARFSTELEALVRSLKGIDIVRKPDEWVLFTPPYSTAEPAVRPLGNKIASAFAIPHIDFRTTPEGDRGIQYAGIVDTQSRIQAKFSVEPVLPDPEAVIGKRALVIDDMITTGATAAYMDHVLNKNLGLKEVTTFVLVDLAAETPSFEGDINRFLIHAGDLDELVEILNNLSLPINRHILKSLYGQDKSVFETIKDRLSTSFLDRVSEAATRYYGKGMST